MIVLSRACAYLLIEKFFSNCINNSRWIIQDLFNNYLSLNFNWNIDVILQQRIDLPISSPDLSDLSNSNCPYNTQLYFYFLLLYLFLFRHKKLLLFITLLIFPSTQTIITLLNKTNNTKWSKPPNFPTLPTSADTVIFVFSVSMQQKLWIS